MSDIPNIYLDDPDPLSVMLTRLELAAEVYVNGAFCGTWAVDTSGSRRIPFHLIGQGQAWLHLDDAPPQALHERDLVLFPRDHSHIIANSERRPDREQVNQPMSNNGDTTQMVCGFFEFRNPALFPLLDALPTAVLLPAASDRARARIDGLITLILQELQESQPGNYAVIDQLAFLIFVEVLREQVSSESLPAGLLPALFDRRIGMALNAIHQSPELPWTLDTLAERAAMSRSSFAERFASLVGLTPMKYLTSWRMTEARRLLSTTALSTAAVAERSGYESEAAFRKAFKNTLGETPGAVRATAQATLE